MTYSQNIVLDLEFTPIGHEVQTSDFRFEIIQIGAVRVAQDGTVLDSFSSYVKPEFTERVTRRVQRLTGISKWDLQDADSFEVVWEQFRCWVDEGNTGDSMRFVTWSKTDRAQLRAETAVKGVDFGEDNARWLDLQKIYPRFMGVGDGNQMALRVAADWYGISVSQKNLHGALYDARLTAELFKNLVTKDYLVQKECLAAAMPKDSQTHAITFTIGDKFSALLQLKEQLEAAA